MQANRDILKLFLRCGMIRPGASVILCVIALVASSCSEEKPVSKPSLSRVRAVVVQAVDYRQGTTVTGEIAAKTQSDLSFRTGGVVTHWYADVGQHVKAGELLAQIDTQQQDEDVVAAKAALKAAESALRQSASEFERQKTLLAKGATPRAIYEQAERDLRVAEGSLDNTKAKLLRAQDDLSYTDLRSEQDGIIVERSAELGQVVRAAQAVFTIALDGPREAVFDLPESLLLTPPESSKVTIALVSDPSVSTLASVSEISPTVDQTTGTVQVKLTLDQSLPKMTLGSPVTGFATSRPEKLFSLPSRSVSDLDGKPAVWVVSPEGNVSLRPVTVRLFESDKVIVSDGLTPGEMVVVEGAKMLRPRQKVEFLLGDQK